MPIEPGKLDQIKKKLAAYVKGWTAHALLKQTLAGEDVVRFDDYPAVVDRARQSALAKHRPPTIHDVIREIVMEANAQEQPIAWDENEQGQQYKDVVMAYNNQIYHIIITKNEAAPDQQTYSIHVVGEVDEGDLTQFLDPGLEGGETKITFDPTGDYLIDPGEGVTPITNTRTEPRALQLNAVRAFARAVCEEGAHNQLGLLGTGTGKSFVIASAAEAIGSSVSIMPNVELAEDIRKAMSTKLFNNEVQEYRLPVVVGEAGNPVEVDAFIAAGEEPRPPYLVLANQIESEAVFKALVQRDDVHIILNADHKQFKQFSHLIENKLLLIDESHQHAYTASQAAELKAICDKNATLALTGTPTGELYNAFSSRSCVEFNLYKAIQARLMRGVNGQDIYETDEPEDLVGQAIKAYFKPIFLQPEDAGYKASEPGQGLTIENVLRNRLPPCQKAMVFSDSKPMRERILAELHAIEKGELLPEKLASYQKEIREARMAALAEQLTKQSISYTQEDLERAIPAVNLQHEMQEARRESIKNMVFSFALALLRLDNRSKLNGLLKTGGLVRYQLLDTNYFPLHERDNLEHRLDELESNTKYKDFASLSSEEKALVKAMIKASMIRLDQKLRMHPPEGSLSDIHEFLREELSPTLDAQVDQLMEIADCAALDVSQENEADEAVDKLARFTMGLQTVAVSDQRWATGISIADVLNTVIANERLDFDHNAVCAPLGAAQAVGRVVRDKFWRGEATMISSTSIPDSLIFSVKSILAEDSGEQSKRVLMAWDRARDIYHRSVEIYRSDNPHATEEETYHFACKEVCRVMNQQRLSAAALREEGLFSGAKPEEQQDPESSHRPSQNKPS